MRIDNICTKKTYMKDGVEKNIWMKVGVLKTIDNGSQFIDLSMFPDTAFFVFEKKDDVKETTKEGTPF